jgi:hypothetical protein
MGLILGHGIQLQEMCRFMYATGCYPTILRMEWGIYLIRCMLVAFEVRILYLRISNMNKIRHSDLIRIIVIVING